MDAFEKFVRAAGLSFGADPGSLSPFIDFSTMHDVSARITGERLVAAGHELQFALACDGGPEVPLPLWVPVSQSHRHALTLPLLLRALHPLVVLGSAFSVEDVDTIMVRWGIAPADLVHFEEKVAVADALREAFGPARFKEFVEWTGDAPDLQRRIAAFRADVFGHPHP